MSSLSLSSAALPCARELVTNTSNPSLPTNTSHLMQRNWPSFLSVHSPTVTVMKLAILVGCVLAAASASACNLPGDCRKQVGGYICIAHPSSDCTNAQCKSYPLVECRLDATNTVRCAAVCCVLRCAVCGVLCCAAVCCVLCAVVLCAAYGVLRAACKYANTLTLLLPLFLPLGT